MGSDKTERYLDFLLFAFIIGNRKAHFAIHDEIEVVCFCVALKCPMFIHSDFSLEPLTCTMIFSQSSNFFGSMASAIF